MLNLTFATERKFVFTGPGHNTLTLTFDLSFFSSYLVVGGYNAWFYLSYLFVLLGVVLFKGVVSKDKVRLKNVISFYCFFTCILEGAVSYLVYKSNNYFMLFVLGVISYWIMRYFYDLYVNIHVSDKRYLTPFLFFRSFCYYNNPFNLSFCDISYPKSINILNEKVTSGLTRVLHILQD